jgi:hypothetical protein
VKHYAQGARPGQLALYVIQESVGLPGFPQNWLEPSRIVSLIFDALFIAASCKYIGSRRPELTVANCYCFLPCHQTFMLT